MFPHGETVVIVTAGTDADPYSGDTATTGSEFEVSGVGVADGGSTEPLQDARNSVEADYDLYLPPDAEVARTSQIRVRGDLCDVVGKPFLWRSPFTGWTPGLVVQVKFASG